MQQEPITPQEAKHTEIEVLYDLLYNLVQAQDNAIKYLTESICLRDKIAEVKAKRQQMAEALLAHQAN